MIRHVANEKRTPHNPNARATVPMLLNNSIKPKKALITVRGSAAIITQRLSRKRTTAKTIGAIKSGKAMMIETVRAKSSMDQGQSFLYAGEIQVVRALLELDLTGKLWLSDNVTFRFQ